MLLDCSFLMPLQSLLCLMFRLAIKAASSSVGMNVSEDAEYIPKWTSY